MDGFQSDTTAPGFTDVELPSRCEDVYGSSANHSQLHSTLEVDTNLGSDGGSSDAVGDLPSRCEDVYGKRRDHHHRTTTTKEKEKSRYSPLRDDDDDDVDELPERCEDVYNDSGLQESNAMDAMNSIGFTAHQSSVGVGFPSSANQKDGTRVQAQKSIPGSVEVWTLPDDDVSANSKTFVFDMNGQRYKHPPLPPGWTLTVSKSHDRPWYSHPDYGLTDKCPVPLPVKRIGSKGPVLDKQQGGFAMDSQREAHFRDTGSDLSTFSECSSESSKLSLKATLSVQKRRRSRSPSPCASSPMSSKPLDLDSNDSLATRSVEVPKGLRVPLKYQRHLAAATASREWNANAAAAAARTTTTTTTTTTNHERDANGAHKLIEERQTFSYDADNEDMDVASSASEEELCSSSPPRSQKKGERKMPPDEDDDMDLTSSPSSQNLLFSPTSHEEHKEEEAETSSQTTNKPPSPSPSEFERAEKPSATHTRPAECQEGEGIVITRQLVRADNAKCESTEDMPKPNTKTDAQGEMAAFQQPTGPDAKIKSIDNESQALSTGDDGKSLVGADEERESDQEKVQASHDDEFPIADDEEQRNEAIEDDDLPPSTNDPGTPLSDKKFRNRDQAPPTSSSSLGRNEQPKDTKTKASDDSGRQNATHQVATPNGAGQASDINSIEDDACPCSGTTPPINFTPSPSRSESNNTASLKGTQSITAQSSTDGEATSGQGLDEELESSKVEDATPLPTRIVTTIAHAASRHRMDNRTLNQTLNKPTSDCSPDSQSSDQLPTAVNLDERFPTIGGEDISEIGSPSSSMRSTPALQRVGARSPQSHGSLSGDSMYSIASIRMEKGRDTTDILQNIMGRIPMKKGPYAGPYKFRPQPQFGF